MKNIKSILYICFFVVFQFALFSNIFAQSKTGTTIGQFLKIEPSARIASMGNAGVSLSGDAASAYFNPASLGRLQRSDVQFSYNKWIADISYNYAIVALKMESVGTFSLQATSLNSGEIDVRTVEAEHGTGEKYTVTNFALGLGYGFMLTDRVSVGLQINYINESIWHSSLSTFGLNFGVQYEIQEGGLTLGASVSNFGPRAGYDGRDLFIDYDADPDINGDNDQLPAELRTDKFSLPTLFRVGVSYPFMITNSHKVTVAVDAVHPNDNYEKVNVGVEWELFGALALRTGYRDLFVNDSEGGFVFGAGAVYEFSPGYNVHFDYAWADYGRLDQAHRFTIGIQF